MSVHYKFKSALEYDTVTFDGLHISVAELKAAILHQKRIGKSADFDLQITNAQTKQVYVDDATLIPKNTSLLVARIPSAQPQKKSWDSTPAVPTPRTDSAPVGKGTADLLRMEGSESDKIMAMMTQSTSDYDPSNYMKIKGANQRGEVPANYRCYKCQMPGHWIKNCPLSASGESIEIKRSTGIPRSFMVPVEGPTVPGAMMTPTGTFAVPAIDHEAYQAGESAESGAPAAEPEPAPKQDIPEDLVCSLCKDLLTDAVMIPCCGISFCDECIRTALLESEDHECPDCRTKYNSPEDLIPNRYLRNSVGNFRNVTGYNPRPKPPKAVPPKAVVEEKQPPPSNHTPPNDENNKSSTNKHDVPKQSKDADPYDSDGSCDDDDDNITVSVPPAQPPRPRGYNAGGRGGGGGHSKYSNPQTAQSSYPNSYSSSSSQPPWHSDPYGGSSDRRNNYKQSRRDPQNVGNEERAGTPTVDEREHHLLQNPPRSHAPEYNRRPNDYHGPRPMPYDSYHGPPPVGPGPPPYGGYPPFEQPLPPGIRRSPHRGAPPPGVVEDPLEAFQRMIREKEEKARLRAKRSRTRSRSRTPSRTRSRFTRSRSHSGSRLRARSPYSRSRSRSRPNSGRSPGRRIEKYRSYSRSPMRRPPPRGRDRRSNSFSISRSRSRSRSLSRRRSPGRRASPQRYRSPGRSPNQDQPRFSGPGYERRSGSRERAGRSSPPRMSSRSSHFSQQSGGSQGQYPPSGQAAPRYPPRNAGPPSGHPPPSLMGPGSDVSRSRYPLPPYDDMLPGVQPPPPGSDDISSPVVHDREFHDSNYRENRANFPPQQNYRDQQFRDNPPMNYQDAPNNYRDRPPRDSNPVGYRDQGPMPQFRDQQIPNQYRDQQLPNQYRDQQQPLPQYRDQQASSQYRDQHTNYRNGAGYRDNAPYNRDGGYSRDSRRPYPQSRDNAGPGQHRDGHRSREHNTREHHSKSDRDRHREHDRSKEYNKRDHDRSYDKPKDERSRDHDKNKENQDKEIHHSPERRRRSASPKRDKEDRSRNNVHDSRGRSKESERKDVRKDDKSRKLDDKKAREKRKKKKEKDDKKKKKDKKTKEDKNDSKSEENKIADKEPTEISKNESEKQSNASVDLYTDALMEGVDKNTIENYAKPKEEEKRNDSFESDGKDTAFDGIEISAKDFDLKDDMLANNKEKSKNEVLAQVPELSKWEIDDDQIFSTERRDSGDFSPNNKSGKVTSDVIKRAENAIFAKAINAIRPIEIKKISLDRAKLYSGEAVDISSPKDSKNLNNIQITIPTDAQEVRSVEINDNVPKLENTPPPKLSVKERLGGKVEDQSSRKRDERVLHSTIEKIKSRSKTPQKRYEKETHRRITIDSSNRGRRVIAESTADGHQSSYRHEDRRHGDRYEGHSSHYDRRDRDDVSKKPHLSSVTVVKSDRDRDKDKERDRKRKSSSSERRKEKRYRKEKDDKSNKKPKVDKSDSSAANVEQPNKSLETLTKPPEKETKKSTLDEASFEPDYDETLESEAEVKEHAEPPPESAIKQPEAMGDLSKGKNQAGGKKRSHSASSSTSSDTSSSSSSSSSAKKRKHKKKKSKKKKAKHASTDTATESGDSTDEPKKKKKKRKHKHKKKSSKKKSKQK